MRAIVAGSRKWTDEAKLCSVLDSYYVSSDNFTLIHGAGPGTDTLADSWAKIINAGFPNKLIEIEPYSAKWADPCDPNFCYPNHRRQRFDGATYCPAAGPRRNQIMVDSGADIFLAFIVNGALNKGTQDCINRAEAAKIPVIKHWS